jgi:hypothetical protein
MYVQVQRVLPTISPLSRHIKSLSTAVFGIGASVYTKSAKLQPEPGDATASVRELTWWRLSHNEAITFEHLTSAYSRPPS